MGNFWASVMARVPRKVKKILGPNERVELYMKKRIYHPAINIDSFAVTNERVIFLHPRTASLRMGYTDYPYTDFDSVHFDDGILRSAIRCKINVNGKLENFDLENLPKRKAAKAYGMMRENQVRYQTPFAGYSNVPSMPIAGYSNAPPVVCRKCGRSNTAGSRACSACGAAL